ncbi:MAG: DUF1190 domain-containing protein [Sphingomonadales bacterium]
MRVSHSIRMSLLGIAGLMLAGCDTGPPPGAVFFADLPACMTRLSEADCRRALDEAGQAHAESAPISQLEEECERLFGPRNCDARPMPSNRPYYVPAMLGFLTDGAAFSAPVYGAADGTALVLRGGDLYQVGRFVLPPPTVVKGGKGRRAVTEPASPRDFLAFRPLPPAIISRDGFAGR